MKSILLFSGGIESTTILFDKVKSGEDIYPLIFDDKSFCFQSKTKVAAEAMVSHLGIPHKLLVAPFIPTDLLTKDEKSGFLVPGYKLLMAFTAFAYAHSMGISIVYTGHNKENDDFKDELPKFFDKYAALYYTTYGWDISVEHPYFNIVKADIIRKGVALGVPFHRTISCTDDFTSGFTHCGHCLCCTRRKTAFEKANLTDPTRYMQ
jgi:7-cyano-7-deazaguanine synthase